MGFDKKVVKELITTEQIFELLEEYGGDPQYYDSGAIVSRTICHNPPMSDASHKLYFYPNTKLFHCYTGCAEPSFDIFELMIKIANLQFHQEWDLDRAVRFLTFKLGLEVPTIEDEEDYGLLKEDFDYFEETERIKNIDLKTYKADFKVYDTTILDRFNYDVKIGPWLREGITEDVMKEFNIGFYPGLDVITIPHYDIDDNFIGLRGRTLCRADAETYGKYRPIKIKDTLYTHPLGYNLYGINKNYKAISQIEKAIVVEGEKSVLKYGSFFGQDNNICVACCGSSFSIYQFYLLKSLGVKEIIIGLDKQYKKINDEEHQHLVRNFYKILNRHINDVMVSFIFDGKDDLGYKDSPLDRGPETFLKLFKERRIFTKGVNK